jgi:hypothetical protein
MRSALWQTVQRSETNAAPSNPAEEVGLALVGVAGAVVGVGGTDVDVAGTAVNVAGTLVSVG